MQKKIRVRMVNYSGDFTCDRDSKEFFIKATTKFLQSLNPDWELSWYGVECVKENGVIVDFRLVPYGTEGNQERTDLGLIMSKGFKEVVYIIELKERWINRCTGNPYKNDDYGKEGQEGWMYNPDKDSVLRIALNKGYYAFYANTYPDRVCRYWDIGLISVDDMQKGQKRIARHTVLQDERIMQDRYFLMNVQGETYNENGEAIYD